MRGGVGFIAAIALAAKCSTKHPEQTTKATPEQTTKATPEQTDNQASEITTAPINPPCRDVGKDGVQVQVPGHPEECAHSDQKTEEISALAWVPCVSSDQFERAQVAIVDLDNTPIHIGQLMTPGHTSVFILGAEWCGPCKKFKKELPGLADEFPGVMFTYINTGKKESDQALAPFYEGNKINDLPYAYVVNSCGVGLAWLVVDSETPLAKKIREKLIVIQKP